MQKRFRTAYLELTNICNRSCAFCRGTNRPPGRMSEFLFARLAPQVAEVAEQAYLHIMGEALLHPSLPELSEIAANAGLPLCMTTNGTLFGHANAAVLTHPVYRQLNISLHSGLTEAGQDRIFEFADSLLVENPAIRINFRLWDVGDLTPELQRIANRFRISVPAPSQTHRSIRLKSRLSLHLDRSFEWPSLDSPPLSAHGSCHGGIHQFGILCNGTVTACCLDADGAMNFGNAGERPLREILFSRRFEQMRNAFHRGEVTEPLCLRCRYRERFRISEQ
ncbi:MAG: SPASM domain-containing protein [Victivallales bacterium]|mgnify:FL=1